MSMSILKNVLNYKLSLALLIAFCFSAWETDGSDWAWSTAFAADTAITDISGVWSSQFGDVTLKMDGKDAGGQVVVSGTWDNGGNTGQIVYGRFVPGTAGGVMKLDYYVPGKNVYGAAEFKLNAAKTVFTGTFNEADQTGSWVLSRAQGFVPKDAPALATITSLGQNKHSTILNNVAGKWDSNFGVVELEAVGYSQGVQLKGKFTRPDGKIGKIVSGTYVRDPRGGLLKFQYITPWNNHSGTGTFRPDTKIPDRQLLGIYEESGQTGQWILSRPLVR